MNFVQAFKMAAKSISTNKGRSFLTMLGIIIGIMAVIILVSIVQGQQAAILADFEKMGNNKININYYMWNGTPPDYTEELYDYCQSLGPDVVTGFSVNKNVWMETVRYKAKSIQYQTVYTGSDQYASCASYTIEKGRDLSYMDVQKLNRVCVLGAQTALDLFNFEDPIGKMITMKGEDYEVIGVYKAKDVSAEKGGTYYDQMILVPYTLYSRLNQQTYRSNDYNFIVKAASSEATTEVVKLLQDWLSRRIDTNNGWYNVYSENTWQEYETEGFAEQSILLGSIASIALLVGGIGIMNIMLVTVTERTREIGIRKAIGAPRRSIISQFLIEASMLSAIGGIIGILLGCAGTVVAGKIVLNSIISPPVYILGVAFLVSVAFGIGFGVYPAVRASRLQPVEALRNE